MKKIVRTVSFVCLIALLVGVFSSCKKDPNVTDSEHKESVGVISEGASNYVLVYDQEDALAGYVADSLWQMLYDRCEVSLSKKSHKSAFDYEIVLCNAERAEVADLKSKLRDENDFVISQQGNRLFLYAASHAGAKAMLIAVRDILLASSAEKSFSVEKDLLYVSSQNAEMTGSVATLFDGTKTDYKIIYNSASEDDERIAYFLKRSLKSTFGVDVKLGTERDAETECEILFGVSGIKRDAFTTVKRFMDGKNDFIVSVVGKKLVIAATDSVSLMMGMEYLIANYVTPSKGGACMVSEVGEYIHSMRGDFTISRERLEVLYKDALDRYPTLREFYLSKNVSSDSKNDQVMIEVLVEAMGQSAVFCNGSSSVLYDGMIRKLNTSDYSKVATINASAASVPSEFINTYFKTSYTEGFVDLKKAAEDAGYTYYYDASRSIAIVSPTGATSFANDTVKVGKYTNARLKDRMVLFFNDPQMPEPQNNTEQSRVVLDDDSRYYPEDALDYTEPTYICNYSPSIISVKQANGSTVLYSAVEHCEVKNGDEPSSETVVRRSFDGGKTWTDLHTIKKLKWASLFELNGKVYIVGFIKPNTSSWSGYTGLCDVTDENSNATPAHLWDYSTSVFEPLVANGYLYLAHDKGVASVDITTDIMQLSNWKLTNAPGTLVTKQWFETTSGKKLGWLGMGDAYCQEGNIVQGRDGKIYAIYRTESQPYGNYAIIFRLSEDRTRIEFLENERDSILSLPTTVSRFVIKYDAESDLYVMVSNWWTTDEVCRARNVLGLSVSSDLRSWTQVDALLVDREMINPEYSCWAHAYQYADFDFDGDDLVMTVREATGFTNTFHDGKYYTFYRVSDFRSMIPQ